MKKHNMKTNKLISVIVILVVVASFKPGLYGQNNKDTVQKDSEYLEKLDEELIKFGKRLEKSLTELQKTFEEDEWDKEIDASLKRIENQLEKMNQRMMDRESYIEEDINQAAQVVKIQSEKISQSIDKIVKDADIDLDAFSKKFNEEIEKFSSDLERFIDKLER